MGESSGVGPEIVLHAFRKGELRHACVVFGDVAVLDLVYRQLDYGVSMRTVSHARDYQPGALNVLDFHLLSAQDLTPGVINR